MRLSGLLIILIILFLAITFLVAGLSFRMSPIILVGGVLAIAGLLGLMLLQAINLQYTSNLIELYKEKRRTLSELNEWLVNFVYHNSDAKVKKKAEEMFSFLTKYLNVHVESPKYEVVPLDETGWIAFYRNWASPLIGPSGRIKLDSGINISVERLLAGNFFGTCLHTAIYQGFKFPFGFIILLNRDRIQKNARTIAKANNFDINVVFPSMFDQALMHEVVHMLERNLNRRFMVRYLPGSFEDPFVLEVYNAFRER